MEKTKVTAALEIASSGAKFAVGYCLNNRPIILYYGKKKFPDGILKDGKIIDPERLAPILASFFHLEDEELSLKISADNVSLVLPPLGLQIYQNDKTTNVVASDSRIDRIDISNVMAIVRKESIPNNNVVVDIVPDDFVLQNGKVFSNPPIGERSDTLTVQAKVHTLPEKIVYAFRHAIENAGVRVRRNSVATYCVSQLFASDKALPENYVYVDLGARLTTVSLIGNTQPYASVFYPVGSDDLTEDIAAAFGISEEEANLLKEKYGYDTREHKYALPLMSIDDGEGGKKALTQNDLNQVIASFFKERLSSLLSAAFNSLFARQPNGDSLRERLPLIVSGGGSLLNGLSQLLKPLFNNRDYIHFVPNILGARDPGANNLLGLIVAEGVYRGTLEDNYHGVSTLSRNQREE